MPGQIMSTAPRKLALLPAPRHIEFTGGGYRLRPDCFVRWEGTTPSGSLRTGEAVREAIAAARHRPGWEATPGGDRSEGSGVLICLDPAEVPHSQGYRLFVEPGGIRIVAHDEAGAFYGAVTLKQIARQVGDSGEFPCLCIEDWPDFPNRGVMLDISRDKVPTLATLYMLADMLAEWKVNQLQLYTEHTFAYRNHSEVWENASPVTGRDILSLDAYCRERFIELVPNQNSFGHMERWLKHPRYAHIAEITGEFEYPWGGKAKGPFSLCPLEPAAPALLAELYNELLPHFSSRQFNVGCDETFDLGQGRSREACRQRGTGRVYLEFLLKIYELVRRKDRTMQFWADIVLHHPELIPELPRDVIALVWGYEADHPFASQGEAIAKAGLSFYVCPGTSSWNSVAGRTQNAIGNLWNAAENGMKYGAAGYLNTDWGDSGHWQHLPVSFLGFAYGAAVSWAAKANQGIDVPHLLDLHAFHDKAGVMGRLAFDLGNAYEEQGVPTFNTSAMSHILLNPEHPLAEKPLLGLTVEALERTRAYVERVTADLSGARMDRPDSQLIAREFGNASALLRHACRLGAARVEAACRADRGRREQGSRGKRGSDAAAPEALGPDGSGVGTRGPGVGGDPATQGIAAIPSRTRKALAAELGGIMAEYRTLWLMRNRPGGLAESIGRMERLYRLYEA